MTGILDRPWEIEPTEECNEEDIYYCFRLILGRTPSKEEWPGHRALAGNNLRDVVSTYLSSPEFKNRKMAILSDTEHALVDLQDFKMYVSTSDVAVGRHIYATRSYEPHLTKAIRKKLAPGMFFMDLGANIGYFSLLASSLVGKRGRVFSFEPGEYNLKLLYLNSRVNGFDNIEIYPFAVADRRAILAYDSSASNGFISEAMDDIDSLLSTTLVCSVAIDDILRDITRLDAVKIDVEGAEYLALGGARHTLKKYRPTIFSEFSPPALKAISRVSADAYLRLLLIDENYTISVCHKSGEVIECQKDINKIIKCFEDTAGDHIDIVAYPL